MKFSATGKRSLLSDSITEYASNRFVTALDRFNAYVSRVRVRIEDLNGPRGGIDKRCQARISFISGASMAIEATANDAYAAIDWAAQRAKLRVSRRVDKLKGNL